jgi:hypothetical protein
MSQHYFIAEFPEMCDMCGRRIPVNGEAWEIDDDVLCPSCALASVPGTEEPGK